MPQILGDLRRAYTEEQRRLAELKTRYQDTHPQVQQQTSKVDQILRELAREVDVALSASQIRYSEALSDEQKVQNELQIVKQEGMRLSRLEIEVQQAQARRGQLPEAVQPDPKPRKESGMVGRLRLSNIKVLDYARRPKIPVSPRVRVVLALSLVLAGLFGVLLALGLDALDRTVKAPQDIESSLGLPLLGMLPSFAVDGNAKGRYPPDLYVAYHPRSTVAEVSGDSHQLDVCRCRSAARDTAADFRRCRERENALLRQLGHGAREVGPKDAHHRLRSASATDCAGLWFKWYKRPDQCAGG